MVTSISVSFALVKFRVAVKDGVRKLHAANKVAEAPRRCQGRCRSSPNSHGAEQPPRRCQGLRQQLRRATETTATTTTAARTPKRTATRTATASPLRTVTADGNFTEGVLLFYFFALLGSIVFSRGCPYFRISRKKQHCVHVVA